MYTGIAMHRCTERPFTVVARLLLLWHLYDMLIFLEY
jgi:hypothetical protein